MKSRFLQNDESSENEDQAAKAPSQLEKKSSEIPKPKSRFIADSESEEESKPTPKVSEIKNKPSEPTKAKSRFEMNEESQESQNEEIPEEKNDNVDSNNPAKKKKKKMAATDQPKEEKKDEKQEDEKKKKKKPINAVLAKKIEEDRKRKEEQKSKARDDFQDFAIFVRGAYFEDVCDFAKEYRKKFEKKKLTKKLKEDGLLISDKAKKQREKDELAKQAFLESQRQIEAQLKSTKEVDLTNTEPKKRFWKKRNLDHPKRADEDVIVVEKKVEEIVEIVKPVAQEQKQIEIDILDVDDWEQMIGENFEAKVTCEKTENLEIN